MSGRLNVLLQYLIPKRGITSLAGVVARTRGGGFTTRLIGWFANRYNVDMTETDQSDVGHYESFNEFFTRSLKAGIRALSDADFVSPVDGAISQLGAIDDQQILQAKGHFFSVTELSGVTLRYQYAFGEDPLGLA